VPSVVLVPAVIPAMSIVPITMLKPPAESAVRSAKATIPVQKLGITSAVGAAGEGVEARGLQLSSLSCASARCYGGTCGGKYASSDHCGESSIHLFAPRL
jgi:hypothetical protein